MEHYFPEDADGGNLAQDGRVLEMLSEHTLEGYLLTGRHGFLDVCVLRSPHRLNVQQHAKGLSICNTSRASGRRVTFRIGGFVVRLTSFVRKTVNGSPTPKIAIHNPRK